MKIAVLTGAGISQESGLKTFRDENGLWEGHDVMEVASPFGWSKNKKLVLEFYNQRRRQLLTVKPNKAHLAITTLQKDHEVIIITQNVDDLHERSGSTNVIHLHGELLKARSSYDESLVYEWKDDICLGDVCKHNTQIRPHIVWFGEDVPLMNIAIQEVKNADIIMVVGTSMQVYPAASLIHYRKPNVPIYFIDPKPNIRQNELNNLHIIAEKATIGVPIAVQQLLAN
ncbi:Sir2 family NAD-dependent protein deacetylase [Zhouia sp. PK063]|uniref:Sir2 family NAD-dependent protein deacetylase n=1 Tax=Zhouia sp. PK063 TaxID=3373602 RepID=UPI0037B6AD31